MTKAFNKKEHKLRRRSLRKNMPNAEVILWSKIKNRQMHGERFLRQYGVDEYILDFYCPRLKLAIEIDGDSHYIPGAEEKDQARQRHIESFGIRFLRYTNVGIFENIDNVCQNIYEAIDKLAN
jgi:very-short-patch-repair endonuclease